ncbi:MAG TPA: DUF4386 domain-containing protein [Chitinophagaceae bacterium]|nr:DUF4386 domain-containing protein [Chitinophagaceae bacterium]
MSETLASNSSARIVGVLFLVPIGFVNNTVLVGPYTFAKNYMTTVAAHSFEIRLGMVLGIIGALISFSIPIILLPVFRRYNRSLAFALPCLSVVHFIGVMMDNAALQSLIAVSKLYVGSGVTGRADFQLLGPVLQSTRLWTHWMTILVPCTSQALFFYMLLKYKLLPRFIAIWGLAGVVLTALSILFMIFGAGSYLWLMIPLGLDMLLLSLWLLIKGFNTGDTLLINKE